MDALVTIITPYKNAELFIDEFVDSILRQTFCDWQCIMVDDGSTDLGKQLLEKRVGQDDRFILISNTNDKVISGPAAARNCALELARSKYIAFCDIDDLWHPQKLEEQIMFMELNSLHISVSAYARFSHDNMPLNTQSLICPPPYLEYSDLLKQNVIPMLTVICLRELSDLRFSQVRHEDFLLWLNLFKSKRHIRYACLPKVLAFYRVHSDNTSSNKLVVPLWTYMVFKAHGFSRWRRISSLWTWATSHLRHKTLSIFNKKVISLPSTTQLLLMPPLMVKNYPTAHGKK